jgi:hypothetical protein
MAQKSYLWTTGGAGDGSSTYTRSDWGVIAEVLAATRDNNVLGRARNKLAVTYLSGNDISVASGVAIIDGKPYHNDAAVTVNIPAPALGGNHRIDLLVLRADWTAQTVRIVRVAGLEGASPVAPALTTNPGSVYEVALAEVLTTGSGSITITDLRQFARVGTDDLQDLSVTAAKVGEIIPRVVKRRGGNAAQWATSGATIYTPGMVKAQVGVATGTGSVQTVYFPEGFTGTPVVLVTPQHQNETDLTASPLRIFNVTTSSFQIPAMVDSGGLVVYVHWLAIGPG